MEERPTADRNTQYIHATPNKAITKCFFYCNLIELTWPAILLRTTYYADGRHFFKLSLVFQFFFHVNNF
jgi:hypothetical protein